MKRLLLVCALVGCGGSEPDPAPAVTSYPLCDAEHAWLARCPMADDCARAVLFYGSPANPNVSGDTVNLTGGR